MVLTALLLGGCQSPEYYQERAVNRAREYLLKKSTTLTPLQREYVKFNKPLIMSETVIGDATDGDGVISPHARVQFNIAWVIPGKEKLHMVYGVSDPSMAMWFPERLIIKEFVQPDMFRDNAFKAGRLYALNTLLSLPLADINRIRFELPEVFKTGYKLDFNPEDRGITAKEAQSMRKLAQTSLVWNGTAAAEKIVVVGIGQPDLKGWKPMISLTTTPEEFKKNVITEEVKLEQPRIEPVPPPRPKGKSDVERLLEEIVQENEG